MCLKFSSLSLFHSGKNLKYFILFFFSSWKDLFFSPECKLIVSADSLESIEPGWTATELLAPLEKQR